MLIWFGFSIALSYLEKSYHFICQIFLVNNFYMKLFLIYCTFKQHLNQYLIVGIFNATFFKYDISMNIFTEHFSKCRLTLAFFSPEHAG